MDSFGTVYKAHRERLFNYLLRMTGDFDLSRDIMQESFTRCMERYGKFIENVSLLYRIARNLVVDHMRKQGRYKYPGSIDEADERSMEHHLMVREDYRSMLRALQALPLEERELLTLVATEFLSYGEIADILSISEGNVKIRVHRARKHLREIMKKGGE
ncbi:RNA polymerase sigma factor [Thermodesulfobacteriota bacterium]